MPHCVRARDHSASSRSRRRGCPPRARHNSIPRSRAACRPAPRTASACAGAILEPGQEIEGLAEIAAVIELARDRGQIFQAAGDVVRLVLKNLRRSSCVSSHQAADFLIGISAAQVASGRPSRPARQRAVPSRRARCSGHGWRRRPAATTVSAGRIGSAIESPNRPTTAPASAPAPRPLPAPTRVTRQAPLWPPLKIVNMAESKRGTGRDSSLSPSFRAACHSGACEAEPGIQRAADSWIPGSSCGRPQVRNCAPGMTRPVNSGEKRNKLRFRSEAPYIHDRFA